MEFASRYTVSCRSCQSNDLSALAKDKGVHTVDDCSAAEHKMTGECRKQMNVAANNKTLCFTATYSKTDAVDTQQTRQRMETRQIMTDDRMITTGRMWGKVSENKNWSPQQPEDLYNVLIKYQHHQKERPGKCTKFEYEFKTEGSKHNCANSKEKVAHTILSILERRLHTIVSIQDRR